MRADAATVDVLIIGSGLLGASLGLALTEQGSSVALRDASPTALRLAVDLGAGRMGRDDDNPRLVVVATPPDVAAAVVVEALATYREAVVTDVASVKSVIAEEVRRCGVSLARYVGSHPMAGRERSGALAAEIDLFRARPWVVAPIPESSREACEMVRELALNVGAFPVELEAGEHDAAVARVSHVPQLVSSLVAARLVDMPSVGLGLAGQGLRDVTRIAHSDPRLWASIVAGNSREIASVMREFADDVTRLARALEKSEGDPLAPGLTGEITRVLVRGNEGVARIPGKHGGAPGRYSEIVVLVPDTPGSLGRLFSDLGEAGINIEDFRMEHSAGAALGLARIDVAPAIAGEATHHLMKLGWEIIDGLK